MKIVVDTNIVFSAMLNPSATIGQILIYGQRQFQFYAPNLVKEEIKRHRGKLIALAEHFDESTFEDIRDEVLSCLHFISEEQIPFDYWHNAIPIVRDTDMNDIAFVVLAEYLDARLWTGDKQLSAGLARRGFSRVITTNELSAFQFPEE
ncbi:MAG TPA: PIN domain-containing protein [Haliscomenobacter sp.]|uniref:PIN domain-containing protein n=1 Tax=Haliscomenobacter sp. TaxID=2717303 RepID=UPI002C154259|nr:PIN domain-containing protein [Haliscomenobacter sp.]HOY19331.1 PIN domain-containing protein [Haliscomenobacter sp.]